MKKVTGAGVIACMLFASGAQAGITGVDGVSGGALVPWALLSSGPTVAITHLSTQNLYVNGVAGNTSFGDRIEVSFAHNMLGDNATIPGNSNNSNNTDTVDNIGLKVKLNDMGDVMPQFALGLVGKRASGNLVNTLNTMGVSDTSTDFYAAASKMMNFGGKNLLLNGVLRATKANQMGLLGFGGGTALGANNSYSIVPEVSAELFAADNVVVGAEYRAQPNNAGNNTGPSGQGLFYQSAAYDLHIAYIANKNLTWTVAYTSLGQVAQGLNGSNKQNGMLLQAQASF